MTYIAEALRRQVTERAEGYCEYCFIHQSDSLYAHEADHIIAEKHRGRPHLRIFVLLVSSVTALKAAILAHLTRKQAK